MKEKEIVEIWNTIIGKYHEAKNGTLKAEELIVFRVFSFIINMEMNGVSGAIYNLTSNLGANRKWNDLRATAEAVAKIGDNRSAQMLLDAADTFENLSEPIAAVWDEIMKSATSQLSEDYWETLEACIPNIYDALEMYTAENLLNNDLNE